MNKQVFIVFGKPGAGKSYIAEILEKSFGYFSYDGDDAIPTDMREQLFKRGVITDEMRKQFLDNMITVIKKLSPHYDKVVFHQTLLREFMRKQVLDTLPNAKFLLVDCEDNIREKRYMKRKYFNLGLAYLRAMTDLFEPVSIPHEVIFNNKEGPQEITKLLQKIGV